MKFSNFFTEKRLNYNINPPINYLNPENRFSRNLILSHRHSSSEIPSYPFTPKIFTKFLIKK